MATVRPFQGLRYNSEKVSDLTKVVSPPYDVVNDAMDQALRKKSPFNIIRVELSHAGVDGPASPERYLEAKNTLGAWRSENIISRDETPSFYIYGQDYQGPDGKERSRRGIFAQVQLERPADGGSIRPHERTLPKPKKDRFDLISATRTNISPIFGLYKENTGTIAGIILEETKNTPTVTFTDEGDTVHLLWAVDDPSKCQAITEALKDEQIVIADGHHRFETALNYQAHYRKEKGLTTPLGSESCDGVLMYLVQTDDPGLAVFPIHRAVKLPAAMETKNFLERLASLFNIERLDAGEGPAAAKRLTTYLQEIRNGEHSYTGKHAIGIYGTELGGGYMLTEKGSALDAFLASHQVPPPLAKLDITILHQTILDEVMGVSFEKGGLHFIHDANEAVIGVDEGRFDLAFLLNATEVDALFGVVRANLTMPQKSTFFYPKPATGMVLRSLE